MNQPVVLLLTTVPNADAATSLAERVMDARLAACITEMVQVTSRYRWNGKVETAQEIQLLFKTSPVRAQELAAFIASIHPYDTPEILSWQVDASQAYGQWVSAETQRPIHV